jgi:hypothetical protein
MLSKCANPSCSAPFRYLHEGRIFSMIAGPWRVHAVWDHALEHAVERYWLCDSCAQTMTVCRVNDHAVVRRLPPPPRLSLKPHTRAA